MQIKWNDGRTLEVIVDGKLFFIFCDGFTAGGLSLDLYWLSCPAYGEPHYITIVN